MLFGTALDGTFLVQCMIFSCNWSHKIIGPVFTFGWKWMSFWIFHTVICIMAEHISFCPWPNKPKYREEFLKLKRLSCITIFQDIFEFSAVEYWVLRQVERGFSSCFAIFLPYVMIFSKYSAPKVLWNFEKSSDMAKILRNPDSSGAPNHFLGWFWAPRTQVLGTRNHHYLPPLQKLQILSPAA